MRRPGCAKKLLLVSREKSRGGKVEYVVLENKPVSVGGRSNTRPRLIPGTLWLIPGTLLVFLTSS